MPSAPKILLLVAACCLPLIAPAVALGAQAASAKPSSGKSNGKKKGKPAAKKNARKKPSGKVAKKTNGKKRAGKKKVFLEKHVVAVKGNLPNVLSLGALVVDMDNGHEIFARKPDQPRAIASISKLASTLVVMDHELDLEGLTQEELREVLYEDAERAYLEREKEMGSEAMRDLERTVMLEVLDNKWREHLYELDYLQEGIGLRGMAGRDPLIEYQGEAYEMFMSMLDSIKEEFSRYIFHAQMVEVEQQRPMRVFESGAEEPGVKTEQRQSDKIGRNAPCPCGSCKKYKKCCGAEEAGRKNAKRGQALFCIFFVESGRGQKCKKCLSPFCIITFCERRRRW